MTVRTKHTGTASGASAGPASASALAAADLRSNAIAKAMQKEAVSGDAGVDADAAVNADVNAEVSAAVNAALVEAGSSKARAPSRATCKILVVDDSPTERFFLKDLLASRGYTVVTAESGDEAIAMARDEKPALVLMDVVMPGMSGYQATRAIHRDPLTQSIPVILCTSKGAESDRVWGLRQGARDYVVKPVDIPDLLTKIARLA